MHPHTLEIARLLRAYAWIFANLIDLPVYFFSQTLWQLLLNIMEVANVLRCVGHSQLASLVRDNLSCIHLL